MNQSRQTARAGRSRDIIFGFSGGFTAWIRFSSPMNQNCSAMVFAGAGVAWTGKLIVTAKGTLCHGFGGELRQQRQISQFSGHCVMSSSWSDASSGRTSPAAALKSTGVPASAQAQDCPLTAEARKRVIKNSSARTKKSNLSTFLLCQLWDSLCVLRCK